MHDLGDTIRLTVDVRDSVGALTNATTISVVVTLPDGTTTSPSVTNPPAETGHYILDFTPVQAGRHHFYWTSTGPAAAYTDVLDVRSTSRTIISLADAKAHLNMTSTRDDEELRSMVESVTAVVERHRAETIVRKVVVESNPAGTYNCIALGTHPVLSVQSIVDIKGVSQTVGQWTLDGQNGILYRPTWGSGSTAGMVVTYTAGYSVVPPNYVLAAKIILAHLWQTQRVQTIGAQPTLASQSRRTEDAIMTPSGLGFAIPPRAVELLGARPSMIV